MHSTVFDCRQILNPNSMFTLNAAKSAAIQGAQCPIKILAPVRLRGIQKRPFSSGSDHYLAGYRVGRTKCLFFFSSYIIFILNILLNLLIFSLVFSLFSHFYSSPLILFFSNFFSSLFYVLYLFHFLPGFSHSDGLLQDIQVPPKWYMYSTTIYPSFLLKKNKHFIEKPSARNANILRNSRLESQKSKKLRISFFLE